MVFKSKAYISEYQLFTPTGSRSEETPSSPTSPTSPTPPPTLPKPEPPPAVSPVPDTKEPDDVETGSEDAQEPETDEAVFSDEDDEVEKVLPSKSTFKPIVKDEEVINKMDEGLGSEDVADLEEFQNIDNNLLKDNILKLKNDM